MTTSNGKNCTTVVMVRIIAQWQCLLSKEGNGKNCTTVMVCSIAQCLLSDV